MIRAIYFFVVSLIVLFSLYVFNINLTNILKKVEWFKVKRVEVHGLVDYDAEELVKQLEISREDSLFRINRNTIKAKIEKNQRLKVNAIRPEYPDSLKIEVKESVGLFFIKIDFDVYEIDEAGECIGKNNEILDLDKPIIAFSSKLELKDALNDLRLKKMVEHWKSLPPNEKDFLSIVSEVVIGTDIKVYLRHEKSRILLSGLADLSEWRKFHYGLLFAQENNVDFKTMDLRGELTRYSLD